MMQMIHDSLMPEAMAKFLREETLRPFEPMATALLDGTPVAPSPADPAIARAERLLAEIDAKRDRDAEDADRAAFAKRKAMEGAR